MLIRKNKRKTASRELIMREAIDLAGQCGWNKVTVRALSSRLNYKPPVLYQYFESKDHLIHSLVEDGFLQLQASIEAAAAAESETDDKLISIAVARLRFALENEVLHSLMFSPNTVPGGTETVIEASCKTRTLVGSLIQEIAGRTDDCNDLITHFIALIKGYTFFASEIPNHLAVKHFFIQTCPVTELRKAMIRYIKSIKPDEQT